MGRELPQLLQQKLFYSGRKFDFEVARLRLPNNVESDCECIRHPGGAMAIPVAPDGNLVLTRQYRFATQQRLLEFPAGTIEPHEDPATTIAREIQEEVGYRANQWTPLGQFFVAPGYSDEIIYAFLAQALEPLDEPPDQDIDEDIEVVTMPPSAIEQAILDGTLVDAKSIAGFFLARALLS
jgi:ADP-ribose pyrophosphatase